MDKTFAQVAEEFRVWADSQSPDLETAQSHIDHLIARGRDMQDEIGRLTAAVTYWSTMYCAALRQVEGLRDEIARLLDSTRPRSQVERDVDTLRKVFGRRIGR